MRALSISLVVRVFAFAEPPGSGDSGLSETSSASALTDRRKNSGGVTNRTAFSPGRSLVTSKNEGLAKVDAEITIDKNTTLHRGWLKNLTVESFGYGLAPLAPGFDLSPDYTSGLFNVRGLECPGCARGPVNRAQLTLPPFGANATLKLRDGRIELFTGFGGIEAWHPTTTFIMNDAWLTQIQFGGRVAIDHNQRLWLGGTGRYLYNLGPGPKNWSTFGGDATFGFGR